MEQEVTVASPSGDRAAGLRPQPPAASSQSSIPSAEDAGYEAMVFSAHLPMHTIAFVYRDGEPPFQSGIFRITWVRHPTEQDRRDFILPPEDTCPLCGQREPE